jgi:hypothetical protein
MSKARRRSYTFEFRVDGNGVVTKHPPLPWNVGRPDNEVTIRLVNNDPVNRHRIRMVRWKHKSSGQSLDPLTGTKVWQAFPGPSDPSTHRVRDHGKYGRFSFVTELDGREGVDPEVEVERPPETPPPGRRRKAVTRAGGQKAANKRTGKSASKKKDATVKRTKRPARATAKKR